MSLLKVTTKRVATPQQQKTPSSDSKDIQQHRQKLQFNTPRSPFDSDGTAPEPSTTEEVPIEVVSDISLPRAYKNALTSVITAMAALNIPLFLHCLGNRYGKLSEGFNSHMGHYQL